MKSNQSTCTVIVNGDVFTPRKVWKRGVLVIRNGVIESVRKSMPRGLKNADVIDARGCLVLPGFIDIHVHGGAGFDAVNGVYQAGDDAWDADPAGWRSGLAAMTRFHAQHGTTGLVLTCTGAPAPQFARIMRMAGESVGQEPDGAARILGLYLEGTYLKNPAFAGGQNPRFFQKPDKAGFLKMQKTSGNTIKIVNIVPEYGKPSFALIGYLAKTGVVPAIGHSEVSFDEYNRAVTAGVRLAVHLGNGPTATGFKPPGRNLEAALTNDDCMVELIMDGYHLNPAYVLDFLLAKDFNAAGITDCMFVAGTRGIKRFTFGGKTGEVGDHGACLRVAGSREMLFGSTLTMDRAFKNLVTWLTIGQRGIYHRDPVRFSFDQAVQTGCRIFAENPARVLGLNRKAGTLEPGKKADLVIADKSFGIKKVLIEGKIVVP